MKVCSVCNKMSQTYICAKLNSFYLIEKKMIVLLNVYQFTLHVSKKTKSKICTLLCMMYIMPVHNINLLVNKDVIRLRNQP